MKLRTSSISSLVKSTVPGMRAVINSERDVLSIYPVALITSSQDTTRSLAMALSNDGEGVFASLCSAINLPVSLIMKRIAAFV